MMHQTHTIRITTSGFSDVYNLTPEVGTMVRNASLSSGVVILFVPGSTAGITTIEYESGVVDDLKRAIERLIPQNLHYEHDSRWGDGNGFSHVRAALLGPSLSVPVSEGSLLLGTWQQIVLVDFDNRPRSREIVVQIMGE